MKVWFCWCSFFKPGDVQGQNVNGSGCTLPETDIDPENMSKLPQKERTVFQPSIFWWELLVSGSVDHYYVVIARVITPLSRFIIYPFYHSTGVNLITTTPPPAAMRNLHAKIPKVRAERFLFRASAALFCISSGDTLRCRGWGYRHHWLVVEPTHLKNIYVKLDQIIHISCKDLD